MSSPVSDRPRMLNKNEPVAAQIEKTDDNIHNLWQAKIDLQRKLSELETSIERTISTLNFHRWRIKDNGTTLTSEYFDGVSWEPKQTVYHDGSGVIQSAFLWSNW